MSNRKVGIVLGAMLIFGGILGFAIIKPAIDNGNIQLPWDTTYRPYLYTTFKLCKCGATDAVTTRSAITNDEKPQTAYDLWFGTETFIALKVEAPSTDTKVYSSQVADVDWGSCAGCIMPGVNNPPSTVTVGWQAWEGAGTYKLTYTTMRYTGTQQNWFDTKLLGEPMVTKTAQVSISDAEELTSYPQVHEDV